MKPLVLILILLVVLLGAWFWVNSLSVQNATSVPTPVLPKGATSFEECAASGAPVAESYPRTCRDGSGKVFTENIGNVLEKSDRIRLTTPIPNQVVMNPLEVTGEARGNWFFEASFPVVLLDNANQEIARGIATAEGEWMTTEFVPFRATLTFAKPMSEIGTLRLERDNPSGLPENADTLTLPVRFTP